MKNLTYDIICNVCTFVKCYSELLVLCKIRHFGDILHSEVHLRPLSLHLVHYFITAKTIKSKVVLNLKCTKYYKPSPYVYADQVVVSDIKQVPSEC